MNDKITLSEEAIITIMSATITMTNEEIDELWERSGRYVANGKVPYKKEDVGDCYEICKIDYWKMANLTCCLQRAMRKLGPWADDYWKGEI